MFGQKNTCNDGTLQKFYLKRYWLFMLFLLIALGIWLSGENQNLFYAINAKHNILPTAVWSFFNFVSYSHYFILPIILIFITFLLHRNKFKHIIILVVAYYLFFYVLKTLFHEARPFIVLPKDSFFWVNHYEDTLKTAYKSFPSGHTGLMAIFVFAISEMFVKKSNLVKFLLLLLVILTGFARICTGWHWPIDVLASGLIGYILVKLCLLRDCK